MNQFNVSTKGLTYKDGVFVGEAAEISHEMGVRGLPTEIILVSHKTGAKKVFELDNHLEDADGDVTVWIYHEIDGSLQLHILND